MGLRVQPLHNAVHVETMRTDTPNDWTVVSGKVAVRTAVLEVHSADAAVVVVGQPTPGSHTSPV